MGDVVNNIGLVSNSLEFMIMTLFYLYGMGDKRGDKRREIREEKSQGLGTLLTARSRIS
jgi:hypothetical protein